MVLFDTNAILRYLLQDNEEMAKAVKQALAAGECCITMEVMAEMVYVLSKVYKIERRLILNAIEGLIETGEISLAEPEVVLHAGKTYASTNLDFIDCLLAGYAKIKGHKIFTFDKDLKKRLASA
jgi:predicted nucleic-acid-binding protein